MPLLPLGPSCPLQTILLSDLVGCDSPLQIVMAIGCTFFKFEASQTAITICSRLSHPTHQVQILRKCAKQPLLSAEGCHARLDGQHGLLRMGFSRAEKPSEEINSCLFLMNKKGLRHGKCLGVSLFRLIVLYIFVSERILCRLSCHSKQKRIVRASCMYIFRFIKIYIKKYA